MEEAQRYLSLQNRSSNMSSGVKDEWDGEGYSERAENRRKIDISKNVGLKRIPEKSV